MKSFLLIKFFVVFLFIGSLNVFSQELHLILATEKYGVYCPCEVYIDTTGLGDYLIASEIRTRLYAKEGYSMLVSKDVYIKQYDSLGNPFQVQEVTLEHIAPEFKNEFANYFASIKSKFGNFKIKFCPPLNSSGKVIDEEIINWGLTFDSLIRAVDYLDFMHFTLHLSAGIIFEPGFPISVKEELRNNDQSSMFNIFPNPTTDKLKFTQKPDVEVSYEIFDNLGQSLGNGVLNGEIDVSKLLPGVYFLKLNNQPPVKFIKL